MSDGPAAPFREGRASLRETAKWLTGGLVGVSAFIIGSSTLSSLGDLEVGGWRFRLAAGSLVGSVALAWVVVIFAIRVLRSDLKGLKQFMEADGGELEAAREAVAATLGASLHGGHTLGAFYSQYQQLRIDAWTAAGAGTEAAEKAVARVDAVYETCREACVSQMLVHRFDQLTLAALSLGGPIFAGFLAFTWAANPPDDGGLLDKPYTEALTPDQVGRLQGPDIDVTCLGPDARLLIVATAKAGGRKAVLLPSKPQAAAGTVPVTCSPHTVTLAGKSVVAVD